MRTVPERYDLVLERVRVGGRELALEHPRSAEDLIDESAFARDERLPYWAELWPSARVLAGVVAAMPLSGRAVLELGCGIGLPSIVALAAGARVLATDWYEEALAFARRNGRRCVGRRLDTMAVDWREPPEALLARAPFDLVLGADILYERRNGEALAALLPRLVGADGEALIADPRRPDASALLEPLAAAGWSRDTSERPCEGRHDEAGPVVHLHRLRPPAGACGRRSEVVR